MPPRPHAPPPTAPRGSRSAAVAPQAFLGWLWPFGRGAAAAPAPPVLLEPVEAFGASTLLVLPIYFAMIAFPSSKLVSAEVVGGCGASFLNAGAQAALQGADSLHQV
jgi:hypothetical protein